MNQTALSEALNSVANNARASAAEQSEHIQRSSAVEIEARKLTEVADIILIPQVTAAASRGAMSLVLAAIEPSGQKPVIAVPDYFEGKDPEFGGKVLNRVMEILHSKCEGIGLHTEADILSDGSRILRAVWDKNAFDSAKKDLSASGPK